MQDSGVPRGDWAMPQCAAKCWVPGCSSEVPDELVRVSHRIKTCLEHRLSKSVSFGGVQKRFCQQCTRFHELGRFDGDNHSCRSRLEKLYARRRKDGVTNGSRTATEQSEHHVDNVVVDKTSPGCADGQKDTTSKKFDSRCGNDSIIVDSVSHSKRACCDYEALPPNGRSHKVARLDHASAAYYAAKEMDFRGEMVLRNMESRGMMSYSSAAGNNAMSQSRPMYPGMHHNPRLDSGLSDQSHSSSFRSGSAWDWRWRQPSSMRCPSGHRSATREEMMWSAAATYAGFNDDGYGAAPVRSAAYHTTSRQAIRAGPDGITGPQSPTPGPDSAAFPYHHQLWQRHATRSAHQYEQYLSGHPISRHAASSLEETMRHGREGYTSDRHREVMEMQMWFGMRSNPAESAHTSCSDFPDGR